MKSRFLRVIIFGAFFWFGIECAPAIDPDLGRFMTSKQQQIRDLSGSVSTKVPSTVWAFFDAVRVDDWETASNTANRISMASHRYGRATDDAAITPAMQTFLWPPISESWGAYLQFHEWNNAWLHRFGREVIQSIPDASIYFGGTDPGRFIISALTESQVEGRPFFTLTQNQLADQTYVDYLRRMYGRKLRIPGTNDLQAAFQEYLADVQARLKHDHDFPNEPPRIKPGEDARVGENGRVQVSGQIAVMGINALIVKKIWNDNPQREFFIEESFPLDWMYPHLTPHGVIFQLNREALPGLSERLVAEDQSYWKKLAGEMIGDWLEEKTSLATVCNFAEKYGSGRHLDGYHGDPDFAKNDTARKCFSKLRASIGGLYAWRMDRARDIDERNRMYQAADLAFRQSYAICPQSPEVIWRYVILLTNRGRADDAILVATTSAHLDPDNAQLQGLIAQLKKSR